MSFEAAVAVLRSWDQEPVVVELEPEGTVMRGRLSELESEGLDGALFSLSRGQRGLRETTGVAIALFRDGVTAVRRDGDVLVVDQGRMTVTVRREPAPGTC